jgi:hypothetical protein
MTLGPSDRSLIAQRGDHRFGVCHHVARMGFVYVLSRQSLDFENERIQQRARDGILAAILCTLRGIEL